MATTDGSPVKTQKSRLLQLIEKHSPEVTDNVPMSAAVLIDVMTLLQSLQSPGETFGELTRQVFQQVTRTLIAPDSGVDFVIDRYVSASVKKGEHLR